MTAETKKKRKKAKVTITEVCSEDNSPKEITLKKGESPVLRFSTTAWLKMMHCRDCYNEEIAAYAISSKDDLLYVEDIWLPKQVVSSGSFEFDTEYTTEALDQFFTEYGVEPYLCSRIWIHTHPFGVLGPSGTDENTFSEVFGNFTWSIMVIFPKGCATPYAAMRINQYGVPAFRVQIPVEPDYTSPKIDVDMDRLKAVIQEQVSVESIFAYAGAGENWLSRHGGMYGGDNYGYRGCYEKQQNDVSDLTKDDRVTEVTNIKDVEILDDVEDPFTWSGECSICQDTEVAVNEANICELCMLEMADNEVWHLGDCLWCLNTNILVNDENLCEGCVEEISETEDRGKA